MYANATPEGGADAEDADEESSEEDDVMDAEFEVKE
jgi:hypothetical protein